jgi:hypothetical protein
VWVQYLILQNQFGTLTLSHDTQDNANIQLNAVLAQNNPFHLELLFTNERTSMPVTFSLNSRIAYDAYRYSLPPSQKSTKINLH